MVAVVETVVSPRVLAELEAAYEFARADEVRELIVTRPSLASLLLQAPQEIARGFEGDVRMVLDVVRDPEDEGSGMLYGFIQTRHDSEEALDRLDRFSDGWWRMAVGSDAVPLRFTLEYV
jgi:hypothetical protein